MNSNTLRLLLALLCVATAIAAQQPATESKPATESRQASIQLAPETKARAVLVEVTRTSMGRMTIKLDPDVIDVPVSEMSFDKWVDEQLTETNAPDILVRRSWLDSKLTKGLNTEDSGVAGVVLGYKITGSHCKVDIENKRVLSNTILQRMVGQSGFLGTNVERSASASVGDSVSITFVSILHTFFPFEGPVRDITSSIKLDSVDSTANKAILTGTVAWFDDAIVNTKIETTNAYTADVSIEIDVQTRVITKINMKGKMTVSGRGSSHGRASGEVAFDGCLTAQLVADAKPLVSISPKFRENTRQAFGMEYQLSSAWVPIKQANGDLVRLVDSRAGAGEIAIEFNRRNDVFDVGSPTELATFEKSLKETDPQAKVRSARTPLGPAIEFEFMRDARTAVNGLLLASAPKTLVLIRLVGVTEATNKALPEFRALLASLTRE